MNRLQAYFPRDLGTAKVIARLEEMDNALKAVELARLLGVTRQHIYKLAAQRALPSFRVGKAVRFDPKHVAAWLRPKLPQPSTSRSDVRVAV